MVIVLLFSFQSVTVRTGCLWRRAWQAVNPKEDITFRSAVQLSFVVSFLLAVIRFQAEFDLRYTAVALKKSIAIHHHRSALRHE